MKCLAGSQYDENNKYGEYDCHKTVDNQLVSFHAWSYQLKDSNLRSDDKFAVAETQDSPTTFSKKIIKTG